MSGIDEGALNDEDVLSGRDRGELLRALAGSGALIRAAVAAEGERGIARLRGDGPPRAVLVAEDGPGSAVADLLRAVSQDAAVVPVEPDDGLPRWAGPGDAMLIASRTGQRAELAELAAAAGRRGLTLVVATPGGSPLAYAGAASRSTIADVPEGLHPRAAFWALAAPLLQALDALGAAAVPAWALGDSADALDAVALTCRVGADVLDNPAKMLAIELAESRPVIAAVGPLGLAAACDAALQLALGAGIGSVVGSCARDLPVLIAGLRSDGDAEADDFFRDRLDDPPTRPRLLLARLERGDEIDPSRPAPARADDRAAGALLAAASAAHVRASDLLAEGQHQLARYASAGLFAAFAAAYLALGLNLDPSAADPRGSGDWPLAGAPGGPR